MSSVLSTQFVVTTFVLGVVFLYRLVSKIGSRELGLPPGPPTLPLLGNLHVFPKHLIHIQFTKWAREYGDIYSLKIGPGTAIVITSMAAVKELLEKNSAITADRPPNHIADVITEGGLNLVLARYGPTWRSIRRGVHEILTPQRCLEHLQIQTAEASKLMYDFLTKPKDFFNSIRRFSSSVILSILFGKRAPQPNTPEVVDFFHVQHLWEHALEPGAHPPVDLIPWLKHVPERFANWKRLCKEVRRLQQKLYFGLLDQVESRMSKGNYNGCFMETVIERADDWGLDRERVGYLGGVLIEGGSDTTSSFLQSLILALVCFPQVQVKAHEELDRVIGRERMPTYDDISNLPYIRAIINEVHRLRPVAPIAIPHACTEDLTYKGYHIPAGTTIFPNIWGIFHDPDVYEDPQTFNPDRFILSEFGTKPSAIGVDTDRRTNLAFGTGRRICPGIHLAQQSLIINTMNFLWGFEFRNPISEKDGKEYLPDLWDQAKGILAIPNPFECRIIPRSDRHAELIKQQFMNSTDSFIPFEQEISEEDKKFVEEQRRHLSLVT